MAQTAGAERYREDKWVEGYWVRPIPAPNTRQFDVMLWEPSDERWHDQRLVLFEDAHGINFADVVTDSRADYLRLRAEIASGALPCPWPRTWPGSRARGGFGTWAYYRDSMTMLHGMVERLGWSLTDKEVSLLDALDSYGAGAVPRPIHTVFEESPRPVPGT